MKFSRLELFAANKRIKDYDRPALIVYDANYQQAPEVSDLRPDDRIMASKDLKSPIFTSAIILQVPYTANRLQNINYEYSPKK